ncbi:MAG: hypothetical protein AAF236_03980 [Verrucomicrobiota bacterium]
MRLKSPLWSGGFNHLPLAGSASSRERGFSYPRAEMSIAAIAGW